MGAQLFRRVVDLVVGQTRVTQLRASFKVEKTLKKEPNTVDVRVWNLAPDTRARLQAKGTPVVIVAGYEGQQAQLFAGDSRTVDHSVEGADVVTRIQCGDGERAYRTTRFSESYGPGTQVVDVVRAVVEKLGINLGNALERVRQLDFRAGFREFPHGFADAGRAVDVLDDLMRSMGLTWSIQDGALQVLAPGEVLASQVISLSHRSGLVGSPIFGSPTEEFTAPLLKVRSLLRPEFKPGGRVAIDSQTIRGQFRIEKVAHEGDTHGEAWYSDLEVRTT